MPRTFMLATLIPEKIEQFIPFMQDSIVKQTNNPLLPALPIAPANLTALLNDVIAKAALVRQGVRGAKTAREASRTKVENGYRQNEGYAEAVIAELPPEQQEAAAESCGFSVYKHGKSQKAAYAASYGGAEGSVALDVKSLGRHGDVQYCHQHSVDGGVTWVDHPPTVKTRLVVTGLPVGVKAQFRFRTLIDGAYGGWSDVKTFVVR